MSSLKTHQFHLVDPSPWPVYAASSSLALVVGLVGAIHSYVGGNQILVLGFLNLFICYMYKHKNMLSINFIINPDTPSLTDNFQIWIISYFLVFGLYDYVYTGNKLITSIPYIVVIYTILIVFFINYLFDEGFYLFNFVLKVSSSCCVYLFFKRLFSNTYPSWFSLVVFVNVDETLTNKYMFDCCKLFIFFSIVFFFVYYFIDEIFDVLFSSKYFIASVAARCVIKCFNSSRIKVFW